MNILICSAGRRVKIVEYFKATLKKNSGRIIAADCDSNAPALYFADDYELIPRIDDNSYMTSVLSICKKHQITAIISLIDPELEVLIKNKAEFDKLGVKLILSPSKMIQYSFDKQLTYNYLTSINVPAVPTYSDLDQVKWLLKTEELHFPLVIKPGKGSASIGINIVNNSVELENTFKKLEGLIIQPFYKDREYGIDVYIDMVNGELIDLFIKEKIMMRSGETDKSISIHNDEIQNIVKELISKTNFVGPIDIDCFEYQGKYYISEINPRFGGGYPHAYEMGCDFMEYIFTNLEGKANEKYSGYRYESDYIMMKYDEVIMKQHKI